MEYDIDMEYEDRFAIPDEECDETQEDDARAEMFDEPCDNSFVPHHNDPTVCGRCHFDKAEHCIDKEGEG